MDQFWKFIEDNAKVSPEKLRLKYHGKDMPFDIDLAITQIECRRRFATKLSQTLANSPRWIFPTLLSGEQSTSDLAAQFHTSLIGENDTVCDLTSGLGIDATHFARKCSRVTAVEQDPLKSTVLKENAIDSGITNLITVCADCRDFLNTTDRNFDIIFIDPARRADDGSRVFSLAQCAPDVTAMLPGISRRTSRLIIKMSPMLDITQTLADLPSTATIYAIGTPTECKELLADVTFLKSNIRTTITAITLGHPEATLTFTAEEERSAQLTLASPNLLPNYQYLLEPYPAVMKAGPFRLLSQRYQIHQLHPNTHLYLSDRPVENFPGNTFRILEAIPFESRHIKAIARNYPALQITTRNFPLSPEKLRAKLKTRDTGPLRLFAVTIAPSTPIMLITTPTT